MVLIEGDLKGVRRGFEGLGLPLGARRAIEGTPKGHGPARTPVLPCRTLRGRNRSNPRRSRRDLEKRGTNPLVIVVALRKRSETGAASRCDHPLVAVFPRQGHTLKRFAAGFTERCRGGHLANERTQNLSVWRKRCSDRAPKLGSCPTCSEL